MKKLWGDDYFIYQRKYLKLMNLNACRCPFCNGYWTSAHCKHDPSVIVLYFYDLLMKQKQQELDFQTLEMNQLKKHAELLEWINDVNQQVLKSRREYDEGEGDR